MPMRRGWTWGQLEPGTNHKVKSLVVPFVRFYGRGYKTFRIKATIHVQGEKPVTLHLVDRRTYGPADGLIMATFDHLPKMTGRPVVDVRIWCPLWVRPVSFGIRYLADRLGEKI